MDVEVTVKADEMGVGVGAMVAATEAEGKEYMIIFVL